MERGAGELPSAVVSAVLSYLVDADVASHGATDRSAAALTEATWHARVVSLLPTAQRHLGLPRAAACLREAAARTVRTPAVPTGDLYYRPCHSPCMLTQLPPL